MQTREQTVSEAYGLPPVLVGQCGSERGDAALEAWRRATGQEPHDAMAHAGEQVEYLRDAAPLPADDLARRATLEHPCAVPWCSREAVWSWQRTPAELRAMYKGVKQAGPPELVREVCEAHRPSWRSDVYVPIGQLRQVEAPAATKRAPKRAPAPAATAPALAAVLAELADTRKSADLWREELAAAREALERERKQAELYRQSWSAHREALELLRQARAELASLRASVEAPADLLAELVA